MRGIRFFRAKAAAFAASERGNFAVITAGILTVLMFAAGLAVNTVEISLTRSNLQQALDAAVTSTARDLTTGTIEPQNAKPTVMAFLTANGGTGFASAGKISLDQLDVDQGSKTVSAAASVDIAMLFPVFSGSSVYKVKVESAAKYSDQSMEVSMVLDVTGSMADSATGRRGGSSKISGLKTAAADAVHELLDGQDPDNPRVKVAVVPYADSVNVGSSLAKSSVFVERTKADRKLDLSNSDPILAGFQSRPDDCATERKSDEQYTDDGPDVSMVHRDLLLARNNCPSAALVPLTTDETKLTDMIGQFTPGGFTAGHIGVQWGWYMLSPHWSDVLPATSIPAAYNPDKVTKVMILMTDGLFNTAYFDARSSDDIHNQVADSNTAATRLCAQMKKEGIQIFTIGFGLRGGDSDAKDVLKACASTDTPTVKYFYEAADNDDLDATFKKIVADLQKELVLTR